MSVETEILQALSGDVALMALLGSGDRLMNGNLKKKLPLPPPLILVETLCGEPEVVGEEGILADRWTCSLWLIAEGSVAAIEEAAKKVMEQIGFELTAMDRIPADKPEMTCLEVKFDGFRIRQ